MVECYLGMISGTSVDGVDAVIAEFADRECRVVVARTTPYPPALAERVHALIETPVVSLAELGAVDVAVGRFFAECASALVREADLHPSKISAVGTHGQTIFHGPEGSEPFTLQIGDPNCIAAATGIPTVADFRRLDMALGGQGAPMVPAFHDWLFASSDEPRIVLNIGGIANVTVLVPGEPPLGFDTGPGNALLDQWIMRCRGEPFDRSGAWAAAGRADSGLLELLLQEPYFALQPPKSTGRELFNLDWLERRLATESERPADEDLQATLAELTARSIAEALTRIGHANARLIVCGGGAYNRDLLSRLERIRGGGVETSAALGLAPDWVEATAFAWLARARLKGAPGNIPNVTGARHAAVLGGLYYGGVSET